MSVDNHKNAAWSLVATAPSPATSGTSLVVTAGEGARFPSGSFDVLICPNGAAPVWGSGGATAGNFEMCRATISTDTVTLTRAQYGTTARSIQVGDQIFVPINAKTLTDIEGLTPALFPGAEIGYDQITSNVNIGSSTEASGTTIITCAAHTFDGSPVWAEFSASNVYGGGANNILVCLFEGATEIGKLCQVRTEGAVSMLAYGRLRFTPTAGSHTYTVTAFATSLTGPPNIGAGAGGTGAYVPASIVFKKV